MRSRMWPATFPVGAMDFSPAPLTTAARLFLVLYSRSQDGRYVPKKIAGGSSLADLESPVSAQEVALTISGQPAVSKLALVRRFYEGNQGRDGGRCRD